MRKHKTWSEIRDEAGGARPPDVLMMTHVSHMKLVTKSAKSARRMG